MKKVYALLILSSLFIIGLSFILLSLDTNRFRDPRTNLFLFLIGLFILGFLYAGARPNIRPDEIDVPNEISARLTEGENILIFIKPYDNLHLRSLILTNKKIIFFLWNFSVLKRGLKGINYMTEYRWSELKNVSISHDHFSSIQFNIIGGGSIYVDYLRREEAEKIYAISTGMKEKI